MYGVQEVWLKPWSELSDPAVLHFLKAQGPRMRRGMSKAVYKAETPGGEV